MTTGGCCVTECLTTVQPGHVMCGSHWARVPMDVKREIYHQRARQARQERDAPELLATAIEAATQSVQ